MLTVYKYPLERYETILNLPIGAKQLSVQIQEGVPCLWCLVDPKETFHILRRFRFYETGSPIEWVEEGIILEYVGTIQTNGGLVYHLFEV